MRVLYSTGSAAGYMAPPLLGDLQVNCGPDWPDAYDKSGRVLSLSTPVGEYDLAKVAAKLPKEQLPDVVVCLVDASRRNLPRNLGALKCPRVLLIADTHHMRSPVLGLLSYATQEPFSRRVLLYDRHHAEIFRAAGVRDLHWFPGLTFPHTDEVVRRLRSPDRQPHIAFVGQAGRFHPRRARLLAALQNAGVALDTGVRSQVEAMTAYGRALAGFNASLNGDLNLRVFEILAAGACLVTDELGQGSGLRELFESSGFVRTYRNEEELVASAASLLATPSATAQLGRAAAQWFDAHLGEQRRRKLFESLVFEGKAAPEFSLMAGGRPVLFAGATDRLLKAVLVYEAVQEQHRTQERVRIAVSHSSHRDIAALFSTLPRVELKSPSDEADMGVFSAGESSQACAADVSSLWCWDAQPNPTSEFSRAIVEGGYMLSQGPVALYWRTPEKCAAGLVKEWLRRGDQQKAVATAVEILKQHPRDVEVLRIVADIAVGAKDIGSAVTVLSTICKLAPNDFDAVVALSNVQLQANAWSDAAESAQRALRLKPNEPRAVVALWRARNAEGRGAELEPMLRACAEGNPRSTQVANVWGSHLRKTGRLLEGLQWQRRAAGASDRIAFVPGNRPIRVAFLVQHPQGWTSMESVWRSMRDDPAFEPVLVAAPYQHPYPPEGGADAIYGYLSGQGLPFQRWDEFPLDAQHVDILFVQNPYDITRAAPLQTPELVKRVGRLAYVPYGLEIGGGATNAVNQFDMPLQQHAWVVFARSDRHRAMFSRHCTVGDAHVVVTGHPRMDTLRGLADLAPDPEFVHFAKGRKIVFWNPQFDIRNDGTGYSTFMIWQRFLVAEFARRPDLAFVIRPHPLFFGTLEARRLWTSTDIAEFHGRIERAGNILIDRRPSYLPIFAASAAMLSDASTFLLEYTATGKPLLYLHNPKGPSLNDDGRFMRPHWYSAEAEADITSFLDMVSAGKDPGAEARRNAFSEVMRIPPEGVAEAIKRSIRARLEADRMSTLDVPEVNALDARCGE